jgi:membrane protein
MPLENLIDFFEKTFPKNVYDTILPFIQGKGFDANVGIFIFLGFILASNGTHSIILASNKLYDFKDDDWLKRRIKAIILIILVIGLMLITMLVLAFGNDITKMIFDLLKTDTKNNLIYQLIIYLKWPITMFVILIVLKMIYVIAPDKKIQAKNTTRGAIFSTISISLITYVYSHFFLKFNSYDVFYGSLSNIAIMMIWIYLLSFIIVIGIAINVNDYRNREEKINNDNNK